MQYMLLIYENERAYEGEAGQATLSAIVARHVALAQEMAAAGAMVGGEELQPTSTATTVVTSGGMQTLHDGPFAETREQLGGYYVIEAPDLDAAIGWARKVPVTDGGRIEVRPINPYIPADG